MSEPSSDPSSKPATPGAAPPRDRRRTVLLVSACTLFALGIGLNVQRYSLSAPPSEDAEFEETEPPPEEFVYSSSAEPKYAAAAEMKSEAGGQGQRHLGEEGRMGVPSARKAGLYAMKGPKHATPARLMRRAPAPPPPEPGDARGDFIETVDDSKSTFSIDVDTGSYTLMRRDVSQYNDLPDPASIRVEEYLNYFDYDYPEPTGTAPIGITSEVGPCPWNDNARLVHVGLQGKHVAADEIPPRNLVFLIDVSGSMTHELELVVSSLTDLTEQLRAKDSIAIVVYAGAAGVVLPPTPGTDRSTIIDALSRLAAGGSTAGAAGIELAYKLAREHFIEGGINRVLLATDGDFNVGPSSQEELVALIEAQRRSGVFLSVLGYGMGDYQDGAMEQLADHGNGNYAYIDGQAEARKVLVEQASATLVTIAKDVKIQVQFDPDVVERFRLVGYANRVLAHEDFVDDAKDAGEVGSGHTVTALYEVQTKAGAPADAALMDLKLRYKDPDGTQSSVVDARVVDRGASLADTSDDFRFSAAVAGFGLALQQAPDETKAGAMQALRELAMAARGTDPSCRRAEFVSLVGIAGELRGDPLPPVELRCRPDSDWPETDHGPYDEAPDFDWSRFVLDVLYLLPPLLGLPLFIMALRRPRRARG